MATINENILQAIDIMIDAKLNSISFDQTYFCKIINADSADKGEYLVSYENSKFMAYTINKDKVYRQGQWVYVLIPQGDFNQNKIILGTEIENIAQPIHIAMPSSRAINATGNLRAGDSAISLTVTPQYSASVNDSAISLSSNYNYGFTDRTLKYIVLSADFTALFTGSEPTGDYGLALSINHRPETYGGISSTNFYGNPYNIENLTQQVLLAMPKERIETIQLKLYALNNFSETVEISASNIQVYFAYDKEDFDIETPEISAYLPNFTDSTKYNTNDGDKSFDIATKLWYNNSMIEADNIQIYWYRYNPNYNEYNSFTATYAGEPFYWQPIQTDNPFKISQTMDLNEKETKFRVAAVKGTTGPLLARDEIVFTNISNSATSTTYYGTSTSSDERRKNTIELLDTKYNTLLDNLDAKTFYFNNYRTNIKNCGFIAQEVLKALTQSGLSPEDFGGFVDLNGDGTDYALDYSQFIPILWNEIKVLRAQIENLEKKEINTNETE